MGISKTAIIAGTGLYEGLPGVREIKRETVKVGYKPRNAGLGPVPMWMEGAVDYSLVELPGDTQVCVFSRHGFNGANITPAEITHPAVLMNLAKNMNLGGQIVEIERIVASSAVGSDHWAPGTLVTVEDFVGGASFIPLPPSAALYTSMVPAVDANLIEYMHRIAKKHNIALSDGAGYVQDLKGNRFETPTEIYLREAQFAAAKQQWSGRKAMQRVEGLVFGMTAADEAFAARAHGINYAVVGVVTNAVGVEVSHDENKSVVASRQKDLATLLLETAAG